MNNTSPGIARNCFCYLNDTTQQNYMCHCWCVINVIIKCYLPHPFVMHHCFNASNKRSHIGKNNNYSKASTVVDVINCYNYTKHNTTHMNGKQLNILNIYIFKKQNIYGQTLKYIHVCKKKLRNICENLKYVDYSNEMDCLKRRK